MSPRRIVRAVLATVVVLASSAPALARDERSLPPAVDIPIHSRSEGWASGATIPSDRPPRVQPRRPRDAEGLQRLKESLAAGAPDLPAAPDVHDDRRPRVGEVLSVVSSFEGLANTDNPGPVSPSDANLGVGPDHVFEIVNVTGRIFDKSGGVVSTFTARSFFQVDASAQASDPSVIYDAASGRWFATILQFTNSQSSLILAVSTTSDPTGPFCRYRLGNPTSETFLLDFPQLGVSDDKVVVTYNGFTISGSGFLGAGYYVVNKADLVGCAASVSRSRVAPNATRFGVEPSRALSSTSTLHMATNDGSVPGGSAVTVFAVNGVPGVGPVTESSFGVTVGSWLTPPNAPQPGSAVRIDTNDESVITAVWRGGSLWIGGNEVCGGADKSIRSCLRVIEIRTDSQTVQQDITFGAPDQFYYYPALGLDGAGNLFVVFNASSPADFVGVRITGRLASDPPGTLAPSTLLRAGGGAQSSTRMGDYYSAAVDPADPATVWVTGEYVKASGSSDWGTFIAQLTFAPVSPTLALVPNATTFTAGETLHVALSVSNPGVEQPVDVYLGIALPASAGPAAGCPMGDAVAFDSGGAARMLVTVCVSSGAGAFPRFFAGATLPGGLPPTSVPEFFTLPWAGRPPGQYVVFMLFAAPNSFLDGTIDAPDIIAITVAIVTLS